jgi:hypothetical protein
MTRSERALVCRAMDKIKKSNQEALSNVANAGRYEEFVRPATEPRRAASLFEIAVVGFAILGLIAAELMLSSAIRGTNFGGGDGKMAQAVILAAYKFGGFLQFNNINPIQGLGSELLPINVWIDPSYWPFAVLDKAQAANASAAIALAIFAIASYVMARCFDVPIIPSAIAAQLTIVLFAPMLSVLQLSPVFSLMVGHAVVNAPYMIALGLLSRLGPGSWRSFALITAGIFALLFYSVCCDPLWSVVCCSSWALPFAIVALSPMRPKAVLVRCAALAFCLLLLAVTGAAEYLLTLTLSTARLQFPAVGDRVRLPDFSASTLFYSPYMKYFYLAWVPGWLLGLCTLRGRARGLVVAGIASCAALLAEILVYLLLQNAPWSFPLPQYAEQSLFSLFLASAVAGYWGALRAAASWARALVVKMRRGGELSWRWLAKAKGAAVFVVIALVPAAVVYYAINRPAWMADVYNEPWPNEPELAQFLVDNIAQDAGKPFRGAVLFYFMDYPIHVTIANLWARSVPTVSEYGQLVTPQSMYFNASVLKTGLALNNFTPIAAAPDDFSRVLPMLGTRYYVVGDHQILGVRDFISIANQIGKAMSQSGHPVVTLPQGAHHNVGPAARWHVYEIPHPNLGDYSPTIAMTAETGAAAAAIMVQPNFDFTKQVVLSTTTDKSLVPARNMELSLIRGGLHVSGRTDGTSLVVLPQQFSHCLRARDASVRLVRANLMMTGMIFSGETDTDIIFDYGLFTPRCRWADISDVKKLKMQIDARAVPLSGGGLFPNWEASVAKLRAAASAIK